jgi:hypothetical protein
MWSFRRRVSVADTENISELKPISHLDATSSCQHPVQWLLTAQPAASSRKTLFHF